MLDFVDPGDVGLSAAHLEQLTRHLDAYVAGEKFPFVSALIARYGKPAYMHINGLMDREAAKPAAEDTIVRAYSMTKPITSVAAMMLYEEGRFQLDDPISRYIPAFAEPRVLIGGDAAAPETRAAAREITMRDILSHTSGLTYGRDEGGVVAELYKAAEIVTGGADYDLAEFCRRLGAMPLVADPGSRWNYSVSTDVLGHLVERLSDRPLDQFFASRIFEPLGMVDTAFDVPADKHDRFAACYQPGPDGGLKLQDAPAGSRFARPTKIFSGGGGLLSTIGDYYRFAQMLADGGSFDGHRLLGPRTVDFMASNQLPNNCDMASIVLSGTSESSYDGIGFGLGLAVIMDPLAAQMLSSPGEYGWGGLASTHWRNDPLEDLTIIFMTQLVPSSTHDIRRELRTLIYSALTD